MQVHTNVGDGQWPPIPTLIVALSPLPALLVVMVVVVVHVVDVGEWCGGVVVVASSKGGDVASTTNDGC